MIQYNYENKKGHTFTSDRWGIAVNSGNYFPAVSGMVINRTHEATLNFAIVANIPEEDNLTAGETVAAE